MISARFLTASNGCHAIATSTHMLSNDDTTSQTSGALGDSPSETTLVNRRTEGTNTYVTVTANNKQEFNCILNGGSFLSFGMAIHFPVRRRSNRLNQGLLTATFYAATLTNQTHIENSVQYVKTE